jgi:outer membrane receptor for ferrienterochelin and colicins
VGSRSGTTRDVGVSVNKNNRPLAGVLGLMSALVIGGESDARAESETNFLPAVSVEAPQDKSRRAVRRQTSVKHAARPRRTAPVGERDAARSAAGPAPAGVAAGASGIPLVGPGSRAETQQQEAEQRRRDSAVQKIIVPEAEVERFGDGTLGDVLRRQPGMSFTGPAGTVKDIRLRGLDKGYTQFTVDGLPAPTATKERQLQVDRLPADMIESVEIIRNPSAMNESGNIGGIVNVVLKKDMGDLTRFRASGGKQGRLGVGEANALWSRRFDSVDVMFSGSRSYGAEDIVEDKDTYNAKGDLTGREHKPKPVAKTDTTLAPRLVWRLGETRLTLEPFLTIHTEDKDEKSDVRNLSGDLTKRTTNEEYREDMLWRAAGRYEARVDGVDFTAKFGLQEAILDKTKAGTEADAAGVVKKYTNELEKVRERLNYVGVGATGMFGYDLLVAQQHKPSIGLEWRDAGYDAAKTTTENGLVKDAPKERYDIGERRLIAYAQDEWRIAGDHWLTPGVRFEHIVRNATDSRRNSRNSTVEAVNPSLHYRWAMTEELNFRASVAQTVRMPKFDDLNPLVTLATGAAAGTITNPHTAGNPDLRPERALGFEAGVEKFFADRRGVVGINVYDREVENFIQKATRLEGARYIQRPENVGDARFWGLELDWRIPLSWDEAYDFALIGNHSEMRGRVRNSTSGGYFGVKDMPPRVTNVGLEWRHAPTAVTAGFAFNYQPSFVVEGSDGDGREIKRRNQQTLLDLYVSKAIDANFEIRLVAKNVLSVVKEEAKVKLSDSGAVTGMEWKAEHSKPTVYVVLQGRF